MSISGGFGFYLLAVPVVDVSRQALRQATVDWLSQLAAQSGRPK